MPGSWHTSDFPRLDDTTCDVTSPCTRLYNCLAWAAGEDFRRWEPDPFGQWYWPDGVPRQLSVEAFVLAYQTIGFLPCFTPALEDGIEKIAVYAVDIGNEKLFPTHAALQLESGRWTSKMGDLEDIHHGDAEDVNGPLYGRPVVYMQRKRIPTTI
jgi:hypothetical protein